jgi:hypothetical protein
MPDPSEQAGAFVPTENVRNGPNVNMSGTTFTVRRKVAKRIYPWDLPASEVHLVQVVPEGIPAKKKPRLEEQFPTTTDEGASDTDSYDAKVATAVNLSTPLLQDSPKEEQDGVRRSQRARDNPIGFYNNERILYGPTNDDRALPVAKAIVVGARRSTRTRGPGTFGDNKSVDFAPTMNAATLATKLQNSWRATDKWTPEEHAQLTRAVQKHGKNWVAIAALVRGRTNDQCRRKWLRSLEPITIKWTAKEDAQLTSAVKKHGKNWVAIAALIQGRTNDQCRCRWRDLERTISWAKGKWTAKEDGQLTSAVKIHGNNWFAVAALILGRRRSQCRCRWEKLYPTSGWAKGKFTTEEDAQLTSSVKKHGKNWVAIAALLRGRTNDQCRCRWRDLDPTIERVSTEWTAKEDAKLTSAAKKHGNNWIAVAALLRGRTNRQCRHRWCKYGGKSTTQP